MIDRSISLSEAFRAMYYFLEHEYLLTKSEDVADILSALSWTTFSDGKPTDPAAWTDWLGAVEKALNSSK